ncbi:hypothetical protein ACOYW6_05790 [Parablastomonas sp. CN1-191]|uniref:hypothetical protein n=1 Tax=Parablastomonas sp. CN1-191 TaxID=3400908 RepID=UPI003BF8451D
MIDRKTADQTPETHNSEQDDEDTQAQTVADQAMERNTSVLGLSDTEKVSGGLEDDNVQDLVDHMNQMETSGVIDNSAFLGERNDDDEEGILGEAAED